MPDLPHRARPRLYRKAHYSDEQCASRAGNGGNGDRGPGTWKAENKGGNREPATGNRGGIRTTFIKAKAGPGTGKAINNGGNGEPGTGVEYGLR